MSQRVRDTCLECGYVEQAALDEVASLPDEKVRLLAALAITHHDSHFSDNSRDLVLGCKEVLGRDYYWDTL